MTPRWLLKDGQRTTEDDGRCIVLMGRLTTEYAITLGELCAFLGVPRDRPSKWRNWVYGTYGKQKRPIPPRTYERLLALEAQFMAERRPRYWKRPALAKELGVSPMSLARWSQTGRFPQPIRINKDYLYSVEEVEEFLAAQKAELEHPAV